MRKNDAHCNGSDFSDTRKFMWYGDTAEWTRVVNLLWAFDRRRMQ